MTYEDEILLEDNFQSEGLTPVERNLYLYLLNNSMEVTNSPRVVNKNANYEIVSMYLKKHGQDILFGGFIACADPTIIDNKCIEGFIIKKHNGKYFLKMNVTRLYEYLDEDESDYVLYEEFVPTINCLRRRTKYQDGTLGCEFLPPLTEEQINGYVEGLVMKKRRNG